MSGIYPIILINITVIRKINCFIGYNIKYTPLQLQPRFEASHNLTFAVAGISQLLIKQFGLTINQVLIEKPVL